MLAAVAFCWLLRNQADDAAYGWERTMIVGLFAILLDWRGLAENWSVPIAPLAALAVFAIATHRAWRELAGPVYPAMAGIGTTALWQREAMIEILGVAVIPDSRLVVPPPASS